MRRRNVWLEATSLFLAASLAFFLPTPSTTARCDWDGGFDAVGSGSTGKVWYFAEGSTRPGFEEWVSILNPCSEEATTTFQYLTGGGGRVDVPHTVSPHGRLTVSVGSDVGLNKDVSLAVVSNVPVVAERSVYFYYQGRITGGHDVLGAESPRTGWYFAEGCTREGYDTWLCVMNPSPEAAALDIRYLFAGGRCETRSGVGVPPMGRLTIPVHEPGPGVGRRNDKRGDFGIMVRSSNGVGVVVERSMYFNYRGITGGHDVLGASFPRTEWYFAEGCVRNGYDTYLCVVNPNPQAAALDIDYLCADGRMESRTGVGVPPMGRLKIPVHEAGLGIGRHDDAHGDFGIRVTSRNGVGVVAERPMYFNRRGITGGHDVIGAQAPRADWYFAEGCVREGYDTYLCLMNPGPDVALLDIEYFCADGRREARRDVPVPPMGRLTIPAQEAGLGIGRRDGKRGDFGLRVRSVNGVGVVAERPVYFRYSNEQPEWRAVDRNAVAACYLGAGEIVRGPSRQRIALTFDCGATGAYTNQLLDVLKANGVRCTFFVTGRYAESYPDQVRRMFAEGHEIANHSYSHPKFQSLSADQLKAQLQGAEDVIYAITGFTTHPYFRFPYGSKTAPQIRQVNAEGYLCLYWTFSPEGVSPTEPASALIGRVMRRASPGAIVLMHAGDPREPAVAASVVPALRAAGYEVVTITELLLPDGWPR